MSYPGDAIARAELEAAGIDVDAACEKLGTTIRTCSSIRAAGKAGARADVVIEIDRRIAALRKQSRPGISAARRDELRVLRDWIVEGSGDA